MVGKARLRTKTGCMTCRERRKKCDEIKPICTGCSRNNLDCRWPTREQFLDRRNHPHHPHHSHHHSHHRHVRKISGSGGGSGGAGGGGEEPRVSVSVPAYYGQKVEGNCHRPPEQEPQGLEGSHGVDDGGSSSTSGGNGVRIEKGTVDDVSGIGKGGPGEERESGRGGGGEGVEENDMASVDVDVDANDDDPEKADAEDIFSPAAFARVWEKLKNSSLNPSRDDNDTAITTTPTAIRTTATTGSSYSSDPSLSLTLSHAFPDTESESESGIINSTTATATATGYPYPLQSQSVSMIPRSLAPDVETVLLPYYTNGLMPSLLHPDADPRYWDFSYTYRLAVGSSVMRNAASACSSMMLALRHSGSQAGQERAMRYYSMAVSAMREGLESGEWDGSEDWLLGAVIALCLFENRRPDSVPRMASTHITAIAEIFRVRREKRLATQRDGTYNVPTPATENDSAAISLFERTSAESFLYHSLTMTLFDRNLDPQMLPRTRDIFDEFFLMSPLPTAYETSNWPILGMPYSLFRLIADVSILAKRMPLIDEADKVLAARQVQELGDWEYRLGIDAVGSPQFDDFLLEAKPPSVAAALYLFVAKILALRISSCVSADPAYRARATESTHLYIRRCKTVIKSLDLTGVTFNRYYLWPLAILGCAAEDEKDVAIVRKKLGEVRRGQGGLVGIIDWIRWTMEGMWEKTRMVRQVMTDEDHGGDGAHLEDLIQDLGDPS